MKCRESPPLVPVATLAEQWSLPRRTYALSAPEDPLVALRRLVSSDVPVESLASRPVGGLLDLLKVQANLSHSAIVARAAVQDLVADVGELLMRPHVRLIVATRLLADAMLFLDGAFVMHVRTDTKPKPALVLLRSALEVVGRAAVVAHGTSDEVDRFANGGERFSSGTTVAQLETLALRFGLPAAGPVYGWLSGFTHYDVFAVHAEPSGEDVYGALAYASILAARLAEVLSGTTLAELPTLPAELPWLRPRREPGQLVITDADNREIPVSTPPPSTPGNAR